ncbi:hypothetical protein DID88_007168 [Monilinia fructigena]|uniref:Protein kinase domain-containing protein n=1 Tax=Monilinia fructigena TaxID=38457 RepID=A0A395JCG8_9HELO|nr:hypothetical protein DID88_007168 [Monilinia fructigena]
MADDDDPIRDGGPRFQEFRDTEPNWSPRIGDNWEYVGLIHKGRSCLVARYRCKDENPPHTRDLTVKVNYRRVRANRIGGYPAGYRDHKLESQFLEGLSGLYERDMDPPGAEPRRPQGIVRQYSVQWVAFGPEEQGGNEVSFLEFCPGVDWKDTQFHDLEIFNRRDVPLLSEIDIWIIFKQFTRMIMILDSGNEVAMEEEEANSRQPPDWLTNEICHYDIEPRNILIGYREDDGDRVPMLKLCDFGDALQIPSLNEQDHAGRYRFPNQPDNGREGFRAPEAVIGDDEFLQPFRHGSCSNIFQFANIIRCLMHQDQSSNMHVHPADEDWIAALPRQYKFLEEEDMSGNKIKEELPLSYATMHNNLTETYGGDLRRLVVECMRESPTLRPSVKSLWLRVRNGYNASIEGREGPYDQNSERRTFPLIHPIFAAIKVAPSPTWRTPAPGWVEDGEQLPRTPECPSPAHPIGNILPYENMGDDLPEDLFKWPRSIPQVPLRHPHGPPVLETRPSVNIPERVGDVPGSITRNLQMMEYYDRMGHMWMGEENYWKMLEAGLDPETYSWEMRIPDPERDLDQEPLSGTEYDEGDSEEDWDKWRDGVTHK